MQDNNLQPNLNTIGYFRAANLDKVFGSGAVTPGTFHVPDVIYAMQQGKVRRAVLVACMHCQHAAATPADKGGTPLVGRGQEQQPAI
jgi:hypothetical protein